MPTLDWLHREAAFQTAARVPTRVLRPHATGHVFGDPARAGNLLIQGDNLDALKALLPFYRGRVKCIFIDPPYNTQSAFEHYDDNLEHSQWLSLMLPRLQLLRELLSEDGSIWVTLDDAEAHYFKVLGDEVFGRGNFIIDISWRKRDGPPNDRKLGSVQDHLFVWARRRDSTSKKTVAEEGFNLMERTEKADAQYQVFTEPSGPDARGPFRKIDTTANGKGGWYVESLFYAIQNPYTGEQVWPRKGTCWRHSREEMTRLQADGRLFWGVKGTATTPMRKLFKSEAKAGMSSPGIWEDAGLNQHASAEMEKLFGEKAAFETPKPEALMRRILHIATNPNDLVLDSFLGSGTTAAVAHKMGRRWIGIEMGEHAVTHCLPRLQKVVGGEQGGISTAVAWQGGGGFQMLQLGAPLFDAQGDIHPEVRFADLAAFIWMRETGTALPLDAAPSDAGFAAGPPQGETRPLGGQRPAQRRSVGALPLLGVHEGTAYYLLFNGILGDRRPAGGNVLTTAVLQALNQLCGHEGPKVVYGEACRLGDARLAAEGITFKQLPHAVPK